MFNSIKFFKLSYFEGIKFENAFMETSIQELEKEFEQINFEKMSNNQEEIIPDKEKHTNTKLTTNEKLKANLELNILSEGDKSVELGDVDIKENQENVDVKFHDSDLDRNFPFNNDLQMNTNKKIELLEMKTQVEIHNVTSNTIHDLDTTISLPLDLESSQSIRDGEIDTSVDGNSTVIKPLKIQTYTLLNEQVINIIILYSI